MWVYSKAQLNYIRLNTKAALGPDCDVKFYFLEQYFLAWNFTDIIFEINTTKMKSCYILDCDTYVLCHNLYVYQVNWILN